MLNSRKKQVTIVVDKKQSELGQFLLDMISEKQYVVNKMTPEQREGNPNLTSENKVIYLAPSKLYDDVRKYTKPIISQYGMEYGWHGNSCFVGVDTKKFELKNKADIVKCFPKNIQMKVEKKEEEKSDKKKNFFNKASLFTKGGIAGHSFGTKSAIGITSFLNPLSGLGVLGLGYISFKKAAEYKNKTELKEHMELANVYNFVNDGLDEFMERE